MLYDWVGSVPTRQKSKAGGVKLDSDQASTEMLLASADLPRWPGLSEWVVGLAPLLSQAWWVPRGSLTDRRWFPLERVFVILTSVNQNRQILYQVRDRFRIAQDRNFSLEREAIKAIAAVFASEGPSK